MPVIINDLEIVTEMPQDASENTEGPPADRHAEKASPLSPQDVEIILAHRADRASRTWAH